jgi:hypothetical protein
MAEVRRLDIGEIEEEVFTRWDITGHQVNRHLLSNVSSVDCQVLHFFAGVGSVDEIGYEPYAGRGDMTPSLGRRQESSSCR